MQRIVGVIGLGTVGQALLKHVSKLPEFRVKKVAVLTPTKQRSIEPSLITHRALDIIRDPEIGIVLEAIDDEQAAFEFATETLDQGKVYISASKKMIANRLQSLMQSEAVYGGKLYYEAAVGGAIPVLRTINDHFASEPILRIRGIVNGSCNYILTQMINERIDLATALEEAQALGYAESDPTLDIDGWDSYYKSIILAFSAFREYPDVKTIRWSGIRNITLAEVKAAQSKGKKIKLLVDITQHGGRTSIDIGPRLVKPSDVLFGIDGVLNGIVIEGAHSGSILLQGPGAGGNPTASAMVGDLQHAHRWRSGQSQSLLGIH